jgi:hypothetical protein
MKLFEAIFGKQPDDQPDTSRLLPLGHEIKSKESGYVVTQRDLNDAVILKKVLTNIMNNPVLYVVTGVPPPLPSISFLISMDQVAEKHNLYSGGFPDIRIADMATDSKAIIKEMTRNHNVKILQDLANKLPKIDDKELLGYASRFTTNGDVTATYFKGQLHSFDGLPAVHHDEYNISIWAYSSVQDGDVWIRGDKFHVVRRDMCRNIESDNTVSIADKYIMKYGNVSVFKIVYDNVWKYCFMVGDGSSTHYILNEGAVMFVNGSFVNVTTAELINAHTGASIDVSRMYTNPPGKTFNAMMLYIKKYTDDANNQPHYIHNTCLLIKIARELNSHLAFSAIKFV